MIQVLLYTCKQAIFQVGVQGFSHLLEKLDVTVDVGTLVFPQDSFRLLDHLIGFFVRPGK